MAVLSMDSLPLGFRFRPTDEELINHYLRLKIKGRDSEVKVIPEIDICKWEPWDLPKLSVIKSDDQEWFFFCPQDRKYPNGHRFNRATNAGYWKATGKDRTIKSRQWKSASNSTGQVGMKKTLVFHRGRAPKGERTSWIMHEYRATQKDLDGTAPGQCAFVLFRLFHKPEEKAGVFKYDEVEQTGLSPTTTKSSPGETCSDLVQETAMSDMQGEKQSDVIKRWLTDKSDNMTPGALPALPGESYMTSDGEYHGAEDTGFQGHLPMEESPASYEPFGGPIDDKVFTPLQSQINSELEHYVGSPFNSDFGNDNNGFHFQDGTGEQDVSLTDLLDEFCTNPYESSCEESTSQKNLVVENETHLSGHPCMLETTPPGNSCLNGAWDNIDTNMAQHDLEKRASGFYNQQFDAEYLLQKTSLVYYQAEDQPSLDNRKLGMGNMAYNYISDSSFAENFPVSSVNDMFSNLNGATSSKNLDDHSGDHIGGTGIQIRARGPQQRTNSDNFVNQGSAARRLRLSVYSSSGSIANGNASDENYGKEEDEVQSTITEAREDGQQSPTSDEEEEEHAIFDNKEEFSSRKNSVNHDCVPVGGTGIKIKTRQPQQRSNSVNSATQGTASRRIRLQMNISPGSVADGNVRHTDDGGEDEVQSTIAEERQAVQQNLTSDEQGKESAGVHINDELASGKNSLNDGSDIVGRTGIMIKTRQPQQPLNSDNSVTRGTAPRRLRLQMNISPGSVTDSNVRDATPGKDDEVQSTINEARETTEKIPNISELEEECHLSKLDLNRKIAEESTTKLVGESSREIAEEGSRKLRVGTGKDDSIHSSHMELAVPSKAPPRHYGLRSNFVISVGIPLAVTIIIAFSGILIAHLNIDFARKP